MGCNGNLWGHGQPKGPTDLAGIEPNDTGHLDGGFSRERLVRHGRVTPFKECHRRRFDGFFEDVFPGGHQVDS